MKRIAFNLLLLLLTVGNPMAASGQSEFSLSVNLAPVYTHTDFSITFPFTDPATQLPVQLAANSNGISYALGITGRYAFSRNWSVSTGVWATHTLSGKTTLVQNGIPATIRYTYSHPFTNWYKTPLLVNYQASDKQLSPYFSAGVTFDFRGTSYIDTQGNGEEVPIKIGKAVVVTPLLGLGAIYRLNEHFLVVAQPTIQYNLQSHSDYSYYHLYQLGLQTQLMYQF